MLTGTFYPAAAQGDGGNSSPKGGTTIHVVQRGENLFRIAMQYGTTVEEIAAANNIDDPRYISVGQRLLIPGATLNATGTTLTYMVKPGDSLATISRAYHTTTNSLVTSNCISNPALLYVGQELTITQEADSSSQPTYRTVYRVKPGENLFRIAVRYGLTVNDLLRANNLTLPQVIFPGQSLWIPGTNTGETISDLPLPLTAYSLTPTPAIQGQSLAIHITTTGPARLSGVFMGYPLQVATQDGNQHYALAGIHAFAHSGIYPIDLTITEPGEIQTVFTLRIRVDDGGYGSETISIDTEKQDLLNQDITEPEWQRFATIMSTFTAQRYFNGVMGLPSTGPVTSEFGTRRSYNGGVLNTFHSGTDFGGASGSPVVAPAAGVVVLAENLPVRGNVTAIDHGWGVCTAYFHQSEIKVAVGDVVTPGQIIGTIGSTGRSTGPHLHWEMWVGGVQVDPMQWVQQSFP